MATLTTQGTVVKSITNYAGFIYIFTEAGVDIYEGDTFNQYAYATLANVTCGVAGATGIFLGTSDAGVYTMAFPSQGDATADLTQKYTAVSSPAIQSLVVSGIAIDSTGNLLITTDAGVDYITGTSVYSFVDASGCTFPNIDDTNGKIMYVSATAVAAGRCMHMYRTPTGNWTYLNVDEIWTDGFINRFNGTNGDPPESWLFSNTYLQGTDKIEVLNNNLFVQAVDDAGTTSQTLSGDPNNDTPVVGHFDIMVQFSNFTDIETTGVSACRFFLTVLKAGYGKITELMLDTKNNNRYILSNIWTNAGVQATSTLRNSPDGWLRIVRSTTATTGDTITTYYATNSTDDWTAVPWVQHATETDATAGYLISDAVPVLGVYFGGSGALTSMDCLFEQFIVQATGTSPDYIQLLSDTPTDVKMNANSFFVAYNGGVNILDHGGSSRAVRVDLTSELPETSLTAIGVSSDASSTTGVLTFATANYIGAYNIATGDLTYGGAPTPTGAILDDTAGFIVYG